MVKIQTNLNKEMNEPKCHDEASFINIKSKYVTKL